MSRHSPTTESERTELIGRDPAFVRTKRRLVRLAGAGESVLITGESGVGKERFARSLYRMSNRRGEAFLTVNCAQYRNDNLLVSELFGHRKGCFTGAVDDHRGVFAEADGGMLFLDEVGELEPKVQAMLLRALDAGEIKPLGSNHVRQVDVRVVTATNRPLRDMVAGGAFREDLFYRLRVLRLHIPPVRERGEDWKLLLDFFLRRLADEHGVVKQFSSTSLTLLRQYHWPGNVREIQSVVEMGYWLTDGPVIEPEAFAEALNFEQASDAPVASSLETETRARYALMREGESFWDVVHRPFIERDLNRWQVRAIIQRGLTVTHGSYKKLLDLFHVDPNEYQRFMDALRHHRLKPERGGSK